jgi:LPXTG-site transpeptidase (sortase) family protein
MEPQPKPNDNKKIFKIAGLIILAVFIVATVLYGWVNRKAFLEQITYDEVDGFKRYEEIKDEWVNEPNRIEIPKMGVIAKITEPKDKAEMDRLLLESVTYNLGSAAPGEEGNVIITGHSSAPVDNQYAHIFATLNRLKYGDEILVYKDLVQYRYLVREKDFVDADDLSVISQERRGLTLITCWPIGTDINRLTIYAQML